MPLTPEALEERKKYIGASDAARAVGLSKFGTPYSVYASKVLGHVEPPTEAMERGIILEPLVDHLYQYRTGRKTEPGYMVESKEHGFMACTPDVIDAELDCLVQLKTSDTWSRDNWGEPGSEEVPGDYYIQVQHEMAVTGADQDILAVLFASKEIFRALVVMVDGNMPFDVITAYIEDNCKFYVYPISRNQDFIDNLIKQEELFWKNNILAEKPPPDASIPEKTKTLISGDEAAIVDMRLLYEADRMRKNATEAWEIARARVERIIGHDQGVQVDFGKATWKAPKAKEVINHKQIIGALKDHVDAPVFDEIVKRYTSEMQGARAFRVNWKG